MATTYDVHAHCVPEGLFDELRRAPDRYGTQLVEHGGGRSVRFANGLTTRPVRDDLVDVGRRLASMDAARVYFDTVLHDPKVVGYLIDWAGADRVLIGSDYPFPMGDLTPVDTLDAVGALDDAARAAILQHNVEALLTGIRR